MPNYLPFDPNPRRPSKLPPPKSIDSQFHVLGPVEKYPIRAGRGLPDADRRPGKRRCASTRRSASSAASSCRPRPMAPIIPWCSTASPRWGRTIAPAPTRSSLPKPMTPILPSCMPQACAARASVSARSLARCCRTRISTRAIARIRELGWYAKFQPEKDGIVAISTRSETLNVPVLIDHMGRPDPARGKDDPNLRAMLDLLAKGNFWVMLSLGEKTSKAGPPWDDVDPDRARLYRGRARPLRLGQRLAASGLGRAAAQRRRFAGAAVSLCARRGGAAEDPGDQSGEAIWLSGLMGAGGSNEPPRASAVDRIDATRARRRSPGARVKQASLPNFAILSAPDGSTLSAADLRWHAANGDERFLNDRCDRERPRFPSRRIFPPAFVPLGRVFGALAGR